MPNTNKMLLKLKRFNYATSLGLNTGYYHIQLTEDISNLCIIITPRGKFSYKRLPMVVGNSPGIFQQKMNGLFQGF